MILNTMGQCKMKCDIILVCNKKRYTQKICSDEFKRRVFNYSFQRNTELRFFTCYTNEIIILHSTITQLTTKSHYSYERAVSDPGFKFGSHIFRCVQADAIIIKLGLNCTHCTGPTCPPFNTHTL